MTCATRVSRRNVLLWAPLMLAGAGSCSFYYNNVASLGGGSTAGSRGKLEIVFDNQTQYRAIFTFGVYDPQDKTSLPEYGQFVVDTTQDVTQFNRGLQPMMTTKVGSFTPTCGRVISFGGDQMISRIKDNNVKPFNKAPTVEAAFRSGIYFSDKPLNDPDANATETYALHLDPVLSSLGVDYECDARLIFQFYPDPNQANGVLISLSVIPASATQ